MPRRGENIYKRKDGRWEGRYIKGYDTSGKAKYGYVYAHNYTALKEKLKNISVTANILEQAKTDITYSELTEKWIQIKSLSLKASTLSRYRIIVENYLIPDLGEITLSEITTDMINDLIQKLLLFGRKDGSGGLAPKTVSDILVIFKSTVEYGKESGHDINCAIKHFSLKKQDKEMRVLTLEEQSILTKYLLTDTDFYKLGVLISLYTGIRVGELCALRWKNVDFKNGKIKISKTLQRIPDISGKGKTKIIITEPKSSCSVREIPIPNCIVPFLLRFRENDDSYILTGSENCFAEPRTMQYHFKKFIEKCNIPPANYHALRHTFATRCVEAGFEIKSLSEILGHSSVKITLDRYVHSSFELKSENMNKLKL